MTASNIPADVAEKLAGLPGRVRERLNDQAAYRHAYGIGNSDEQINVQGSSGWIDGGKTHRARTFKRVKATGLFDWQKIISYAEESAACYEHNKRILDKYHADLKRQSKESDELNTLFPELKIGVHRDNYAISVFSRVELEVAARAIMEYRRGKK